MERTNSTKTKLAQAIFNTLSVGSGTSRKLKYEVEEILSLCTCRQDVLDEVIKLCDPPSTPHQRYLTAMAYAWSNVSHREKSILFIKQYLDGPLYKSAYSNIHHPPLYGEVLDEKNIHLSEMYGYLGESYEGEYDFSNAYEAYMMQIKLTPYYPAPYCNVSRILVKRNELLKAKEFLEYVKSSKYYKPYERKDIIGTSHIDTDFKNAIDLHIKEIESKIENGYNYKYKYKEKKSKY